MTRAQAAAYASMQHSRGYGREYRGRMRAGESLRWQTAESENVLARHPSLDAAFDPPFA